MKLHELTSLQIRDMVSYVHHSLYVIVDQERKSLVFLVDYGPPNRKRSKSYEVWQRFVSQSRRSPFINHQELARLRRLRGSSHHLGGSHSQGNSPLQSQTNRFFAPLLTASDAFLPSVKRGPFYLLGGVFPAVKQRWKEHGLYGCLGFEVRLADVVGLNYLNELQTDGCLALEATRVEKREFGDVSEAVRWYSKGASRPNSSSVVEQVAIGELGMGLSGPLANGEKVAAVRIEEKVAVRMDTVSQDGDGGTASKEVALRLETVGLLESDLRNREPEHCPVSGGLTLTTQVAASSLTSDSAGLVERAVVRIQQANVLSVGVSEAAGALLLSDRTATSPTFHSAQASPLVAGPNFEETSVSRGGPDSCNGGPDSSLGGPKPPLSGAESGLDVPNSDLGGLESSLALQEKATASSYVPQGSPSNHHCDSTETTWPRGESPSPALVVPTPDHASTRSPAAAKAPVRSCPENTCPVRERASDPILNLNASCSVATATEYGGLQTETVVQTSSQTRVRVVRRQRSRSLDAPRMRAVLNRVAEQTARVVAASSRAAAVQTLEVPRPLDSMSAGINGADASTAPSSSATVLVTAAGSSSKSHCQSTSVSWDPRDPRVPLPRRHSSGRSGLGRSRSLSEPDSLGTLPRDPLETSTEPPPIAEVYTDRLVMFRFRDPLIPDELKGVITRDQRLLKMLESGLPTWAIFVQSYPAFCHVYRPWMRRISGYLYFVVSAVTVLIGFYDLYKNLPFVQDFLHRLFGPLYDWVEQWQMGARLGYLGTVLFLQNFQKAFRGAQGVFRSLKYLGSVAFRPVVVPLWVAAEWFRPMGAGLWGFVWETGVVIGGVGSALVTGVWYAAVYAVSPVVEFGRTVGLAGLQLLFPVWTAISAAILLPLTLLAGAFSALAPLFSAPGAFLRAACTGVSPVFSTLGDSLRTTASLAKPARDTVVAAKAATRVGSDGVFRGLWLSLYSVWSDLFWTVFGAVRRIVFGFLAFIFEINKHRLSTYNHLVACLVEAENATWQCVMGTKEIIQKVPTQLGAALTFIPFSMGGSSEDSSVFLDARDHFDEKLD